MYNPTETSDHITALQQRVDYQITQIDSLQKSLTRYVHQIQNVKEYITEVYQEAGEVPDELEEIARMLQIQLTKPIAGEATFTISWRAEVPLDFDPNDMEISFSVDCHSEVEDFDFDEIDTNIVGEEY